MKDQKNLTNGINLTKKLQNVILLYWDLPNLFKNQPRKLNKNKIVSNKAYIFELMDILIKMFVRSN